jgi:cell division protein FtsQ
MQKSTIYKVVALVGIILVSAYLCISVFLFYGKQSATNCKEIKIIITDKPAHRLIGEDEVFSLVAKAGLDPIGKRLKDVKTESMENVIKNNSFVKSVESYITPSGNVCLKIDQRIPKFRVIGSENYYIDTERTRVPITDNFTAYIPIVTGKVSEEFAKGELFDFMTFLDKNSFWNAQIEQVNVLHNNKIEFVTRVGDTIVLLGSLDDYKTKLDKLQKLYTEAFNVIGWDRYKKIDLRYNGQIVCTKR